jgi:hypothetical protein
VPAAWLATAKSGPIVAIIYKLKVYFSNSAATQFLQTVNKAFAGCMCMSALVVFV